MQAEHLLKLSYEPPSKLGQRLVEAVHVEHVTLAIDLIKHPFVDVNFIGTVSLKAKKTEILLHDNCKTEVKVEYDDYKTEVSALFLAANNGNINLVKELLSFGADVNKRMFRGYATTAAVREGHIRVLETLLCVAGISQAAYEEALMEAAYLGEARAVELLMVANSIRPRVAINALVVASFRGFSDFVDSLIKFGVDANATSRVLLQSSKPSLHANVDCNALVAAIVGRQTSVVYKLLQAGVRTDIRVRLGAWSWDIETGEEFRVGAGLAEPYSVTWCAVEFFEVSGEILRMLLKNLSPNVPHFGRRIFHHAILCGNSRAVQLLLNNDVDVEKSIETTKGMDFRPIHLAARLGLVASPSILHHLIEAGCNLNSETMHGETALMISAKYKHNDCLEILASAGADFGLINKAGKCARLIAASSQWSIGFQQAVLNVIHEGKIIQSSNSSVFSPLRFTTQANDIKALEILIKQPSIDLDEQDENGFSALMIAASTANVETFRILLYAGANVNLQNKFGETAISLSKLNQKNLAFEKVMLEYAQSGYSALHGAIRNGNYNLALKIINGGCDVNAFDHQGYTPLMLAARGGHGRICELLISSGAILDIQNERKETALSLAMKREAGNDAESVIHDELARRLVIGGEKVKKHTKEGKGSPHKKVLKMVDDAGLLSWGRSRKRNVICRGAEIGPSHYFLMNRIKKFDIDDPGIFRVVTTKNREFHFACEGGTEMAKLWVRGIKLVTREAISNKKI
ncbi:hypothetical protein Leryth_021511 [Lithospermum erythrorhizon]|nr:hypothetical protein Leryth_021511 [Lithospermum erythrorhizon]